MSQASKTGGRKVASRPLSVPPKCYCSTWTLPLVPQALLPLRPEPPLLLLRVPLLLLPLSGRP